ncbi:phosphoglycerate mutase-like protein [Panus rudis PR-1116 ss-1]|nr:phosphoglycerate mutase-like protein [Panus rudis PR-1116 ss-1]
MLNRYLIHILCLWSLGLPTIMAITYSAVPGFFAQDDPNANSSAIGALPPRFGLLDDSAERWQTFRHKLASLNEKAPKGTSYKAFWLGRHGEGWHNVAEAKYGTPAWDAYWSKLTTDGNITWGPDALLTPLGMQQAALARDAWRKELNLDHTHDGQHSKQEHKSFAVPLPERLLVSPLRRALDTFKITFLESEDGERPVLPEHKQRVLIVENCREQYGVHTCDERSNLTTLRPLYPPPVFTFEKGFTETDELWEPDVRESSEHVAARATNVLDRVFEGKETFISITAHSGFINGFLAAIGRESYSLPTGGIIPVVVRQTVA